MNKLLLTALLLTLNINFATAQSYLPKSTGEIIKHTYYQLSYNEEHEQAEWVYYTLTPQMLTATTPRTNNFRIDQKVSTGSAKLSDYSGSGYDRGHLCPAGSMVVNKTAMSESFYISNISPQNPSFNRGKWKQLEELIRKWAASDSILHVITGPILAEKIDEIGKSNVTVPGSFYKIIYSPKKNEMIGFILPNRKTERCLAEFATNVDYIESMTGIDFFAEIVDDLEQQEISLNVLLWNFHSDSNSETKKNESTQCLGTAASTGSRCKLMTKNPNDYCHHHQSQVGGTTKSNNEVSTPTSKPKPAYSGRCQATTKAGTQCKRNAASGSSYCWQHK